MKRQKKIHNVVELLDTLPPNEALILDVLRKIVLDTLPDYCREKISYNVPYFFGKRGICIIWPATIPYGGVHDGVLLGFWQGYKLQDVDKYLDSGTNKKIFYKIYKTEEDIDQKAIVKLLKEAIEMDKSFR